MVEKSKCRLSTFEGDVCPYVEKAKEEGRLQGQIDLLKEMKSMYDRFAVESEADEYTLGFIKRKWKAEKVKE